MCGSDSSSSTASGPAPAPLLTAENQYFTPLAYPNTGQAASNAYSGIQGLSGLSQQGQNLAGQAGGAYNTLSNMGNNYSTGLVNMGNAAVSGGQSYSNLFNMLGDASWYSGQPAYNAGKQTYGQLSPYVSQALQQGFDPQNALYARTQQQNQDQINAQNAMSGVATTPYGAGVADQANSNFNIDWQNNLLQRQQIGAQTAEGLASAGNAALQGGTQALQAGQTLGGNLYGQGANALNQGYATGGSLYGQGASALGNLYGQGASTASSLLGAGGAAQQQQIQYYLAYLNQQTANSSAYFNAANNTYASSLGGAQLNNSAAQSSNASTLAGLSGLGSLAGSALKFLPTGGSSG